MPGGQPGWARAATAQAGRHQDLSTALKEWWRGGIGTYNILRRPLEMRVRDRTAGGLRQCRANRSMGSEATLKSLRSANKKTATRRPDGLRSQQTCGLHARPSRSAADDPDTLLGISLKSCKIHKKTDRPCLDAGSCDPAAWPLNPGNPGIVHSAKRNTPFCNKMSNHMAALASSIEWTVVIWLVS